jgi:hypothetical protein
MLRAGIKIIFEARALSQTLPHHKVGGQGIEIPRSQNNICIQCNFVVARAIE